MDEATEQVPRPRHLYVHVPFCLRRCDYCDFASQVYDRDLASEYVDALEREVGSRCGELAFETVYVGGGTPTALDHDQIERLLALLKPRLAEAGEGGPGFEFTVEANPGTLDEAKALMLNARGVNRISLGVQSFCDEKLRMLGRVHTAEEAREAFRLLRDRGFDNVSVDLMTGLPGAGDASPSVTGADASEVLDLGPDHVSAYMLSVEPKTRLAERLAAGELTAASDERATAEYGAVRQALTGGGYEHYEISNFARPGRRSRHNTAYWTGAAYLGVGASASSFTGIRPGRPGLRRTNVSDAAEYVERVKAGTDVATSVERLRPEAAAREALVLNLRLLDGVDGAEFESRTGLAVAALAGEALEKGVDAGLLEEMGGRVRLTPRGIVVADSLMAEIV